MFLPRRDPLPHLLPLVSLPRTVPGLLDHSSTRSLLPMQPGLLLRSAEHGSFHPLAPFTVIMPSSHSLTLVLSLSSPNLRPKHPLPFSEPPSPASSLCPPPLPHPVLPPTLSLPTHVTPPPCTTHPRRPEHLLRHRHSPSQSLTTSPSSQPLHPPLRSLRIQYYLRALASRSSRHPAAVWPHTPFPILSIHRYPPSSPITSPYISVSPCQPSHLMPAQPLCPSLTTSLPPYLPPPLSHTPYALAYRGSMVKVLFRARSR